VFIPSDAKDIELTKAFAAWLYRPDGYIRQMDATPGHILPVVNDVANDPRYLDNEVIARYPKEIARLSAAAEAGHNLGWESPVHRTNPKAGAVVNSGILAEMVQRVALNGEKPRAALKSTAARIEAIVNA
jgi:multiple sugar transport system substrate-binding protein